MFLLNFSSSAGGVFLKCIDVYEEERIRWSRNYGAAVASVNTVVFFIFGIVLYRIHVHIRTSFDAESLRSAGARIPMDQQDGNIYAANYSNNFSGSEGTVLGHVDLSTRSAAMPQPSLESYMGTQESYMGQPRGVRAQSVLHDTPPRGHGCVMVRTRSIYILARPFAAQCSEIRRISSPTSNLGVHAAGRGGVAFVGLPPSKDAKEEDVDSTG